MVCITESLHSPSVLILSVPLTLKEYTTPICSGSTIYCDVVLVMLVVLVLYVLGSTVVSPYVGMARKQNGGYNASISVQTLIFHLVVNSTRLKTVRSGRWCCPNYTMAPRLVENVVKVTNLEVVKIEFRHLPLLPSFFLSSARLAP